MDVGSSAFLMRVQWKRGQVVAATLRDTQCSYCGVDKHGEHEHKGDNEADGRPIFKDNSFKHEDRRLVRWRWGSRCFNGHGIGAVGVWIEWAAFDAALAFDFSVGSELLYVGDERYDFLLGEIVAEFITL
jgi:hypothetical protein